MRPIHKLGEYDGRRFLNRDNSYYESELADPLGMIAKLPALFTSQDPEDRRDAARLIYLLERCVYCPDGVWVCESVYKDRAGDEPFTWSAHLTKEEAERWHKFWTSHWKGRRDDYLMLPVRQANNVRLGTLTHPDAKVG